LPLGASGHRHFSCRARVSGLFGGASDCGVTGWVPSRHKACRDGSSRGRSRSGRAASASDPSSARAMPSAPPPTRVRETCTARPGLDAPCDGTSDCDADGTVCAIGGSSTSTNRRLSRAGRSCGCRRR
jgi:hypothetical protein